MSLIGPIRFAPNRIFDPASYHSGGAGMAGTAGEVLAILETIRKGGAPLLSNETVRMMMADQAGGHRQQYEPGSALASDGLLSPTRSRQASLPRRHAEMGRGLRPQLVHRPSQRTDRRCADEHDARRHVGQIHRRSSRGDLRGIVSPDNKNPATSIAGLLHSSWKTVSPFSPAESAGSRVRAAASALPGSARPSGDPAPAGSSGRARFRAGSSRRRAA